MILVYIIIMPVLFISIFVGERGGRERRRTRGEGVESMRRYISVYFSPSVFEDNLSNSCCAVDKNC